MAKPERNVVCPACSRKYVTTGPAERVSDQALSLALMKHLMHGLQHLRKKHPSCTQPLIIRPQNALTKVRDKLFATETSGMMNSLLVLKSEENL